MNGGLDRTIDLLIIVVELLIVGRVVGAKLSTVRSGLSSGFRIHPLKHLVQIRIGHNIM
jgi:hypothetical protein